MGSLLLGCSRRKLTEIGPAALTRCGPLAVFGQRSALAPQAHNHFSDKTSKPNVC